MGRFYVITGLNEGQEIKPFIVDDAYLDTALDCGCSDKCRYYTPFSTRSEAEAYVRKISV